MQISQRAEHRIGPAQLLLAELVTLPIAGLARRMEAELEANPALDLPQPPSCDGCGLPLWRGSCAPCRYGRVFSEPFLGTLAARTDSRQRLLTEAALAPGDRWIAEYLLSDVDEHGLLAEPLPLVAQRLSCPVHRLERVIEALRSAGTPGLCAPTLAHRLALQAAACGAIPDSVDRLLRNGLDLLAASPRAAAQASSLTAEQLTEALEWLRGNISPDILERDHHPCVPAPVDLIVRRLPGSIPGALHGGVSHGLPGSVSGSLPGGLPGGRADGLPGGRASGPSGGLSGGFCVEAVAGPWSAVRVAPVYLAHSADARLRPDIVRAVRFVEVLGRREAMLLRVCAAVLDQPASVSLTRREIAASLGVHESTVSRVVAQKHVLMPNGETVALSAFFGGGDAVRQCLRDLVAAEPKPQSDAALARALAGRGHVVARRTIAKYRAELGIPHQRHRGGGKRDADQEPANR